MRLIKLCGIGAIVLLMLPAAGAWPASTAVPAPAATTAVKQINKRFLLSHNSSVYKEPDDASTRVGRVRARTHVRVIGITGDWLKIKMSNGKVGYIPTSAAE